ncbi:MAG: glycoside hydrolase [Oligoflexia bacterium]|nr:glycoside hydrolase [Oligoflexia bacterium]
MKAFIASRKGLLIYKPQASGWRLEKAFFDGVKVSYVNYDSYAKNVWVGMAHGHWGPKIHVSKNKGKTFEEVSTPKFSGDADGKNSVRDIWAIAADKLGRVYVGTDPAELFYSDDLGKTWTLCEGLHKIHGKDKWFGGGADGTCLHSILIHPENPDHILIGISVAGVLESKDRGRTWAYRNKGMSAEFLPDPESEIGQDPHLIERALSNPDVIWQQNHCGIFKSEDQAQNWKDLSKSKGLATAFGWAIVVDEKDEKIAYTVPALSDETRVPWKKKLIVQKTINGGKTWTVLSSGLPQKNCYDIVYRHAFSGSGSHLLFGTTTGNIFFSKNKGKKWQQIKDSLPPIYSVKLID